MITGKDNVTVEELYGMTLEELLEDCKRQKCLTGKQEELQQIRKEIEAQDSTEAQNQIH